MFVECKEVITKLQGDEVTPQVHGGSESANQIDKPLNTKAQKS